MTLSPALLVLAIFGASFRYHRTLFHPVCAQAGLWSLQLGGLWLLQDSFDPVAPGTLWFVALSVAAFAGGGSCMATVFASLPPRVPRARTVAREWSAPALALAGLLLAVLHRVEPIALSLSYLPLLKEAIVEGHPALYGATATLVLLLNVYSVVLHACGTVGRRALYLVGGGVTLLGILLAAKFFLFMLALGLLYASYYTGRLDCRYLTAGLVAVALIFALITHARVPEGERRDPQFASYVLQTYTLSAIPALDQQITAPYAHTGGNTFRIVYLWLNKLGCRFEIQPQLQEFVAVPHATNVFTYLYPYWQDFGLFGTLLLCFLLGGIHVYLHQRALSGELRSVVFASLFSYPLLMQFFDEQYLHWATNWLYVALVVFATTKTLPPGCDAGVCGSSPAGEPGAEVLRC